MLRTNRRAVLSGVVAGLLLAGCGRPSEEELPRIVMTTGGGFSVGSDTWTIAPDGTWTHVAEIRVRGYPQPPPRSGRFASAQRRELARLANDQELLIEMLRRPGHCDSSDGDSERLEVGPFSYRANWCNERRPRIDRIRDRIRQLTAAP